MEMLRKMGRDFLVVGGDWKERERDTLGALERLTAS
jgi:hypothetical protein